MKLRSILSAIISVVLLFAANSVYSADNGNIDVVLVMDSSGSMKKTDPQSLRIPAAKLFISLLKEGDRAGVISFSGEGDTLINLTPVDSRDNKDKLFAAAEKITSRGRYTNLYGALTKGMEVLAEDLSEGRTQIIILMSDGMMDVGNPAEDSKLVERIRSELSVTLEESSVKVYTIAFTENSDRVLLERISKRTGGFYNLTLSDQDFHVVFTSIFESLKSPEMLPMSQNGFKVDSSVEEVTIVATKGSSDTKIMLNAPDSQSFTSDNKNKEIEWFPSNKFDMITIKNPAEGRWEILFSTGENNKAYIITDLKLKTDFEKLYFTYGEPRDVQVWLEKEGKILSEKDVLDKIEFIMELTDSEGRTTKLKPFNKGDGTYVRSIAPFSSGNYTLKVIARGMTFERAKDFVFNVADVKESKEDVKHDREKKKKQEELLKKEEAEQEVKEQTAQEASVHDDTAEGVSWGNVIVYFIVVNLVLGLGILAFIKIRKSLKIKPLKLKSKREDEEPAEKIPTPKAEAEPEIQDNIKEETATEAVPEEPVSTQASDTQSNEQKPETQPLEEPETENDQEIELDDIDTESMDNVSGPEPVEENTETKADNKGMSLDDGPADDAAAETVPNTSAGTEDEQVDSGSLMSQDDLDALLAGAPERDPTPEEVVEESPAPTGIKEEVDIQDILSDALQDTAEVQQYTGVEVPEVKTEVEAPEEKTPEAKAEASEEPVSEEAKDEENIDDMWAEAFKEAEGEKEPEVKTEAEAPEEKTPEAKAEASEEPVSEEAKDEENIDDMWAEAFKEAEGEKEPEVKTEAEAPEEKTPEAKAEASEEPVSEEAKDEENIDDMWAEAFKEAEGEKEPEVKTEAEAPEEKAPEAEEEQSEKSNANPAIKKTHIIDNKQTTGEAPIDN